MKDEKPGPQIPFCDAICNNSSFLSSITSPVKESLELL